MKKKLKYTDSSSYWRQRANRPGQKSVMWRNEHFNNLIRIEQKKILLQIFSNEVNKNLEILEYGCGIGVFCKILTKVFPNAHITGVDFKEMITVAKKKNFHPRITYISCEAENYIMPDFSYDLIFSSGAITAITNKSHVYTILHNITKMLKPNGKIMFIDPFHKYWPLTRKSILINDLIEAITSDTDINLSYFSEMSFWPIRLLIANSNFSKKTITFLFYLGERLLLFSGKKFWGDYKILLFNRDQT